MIFTMNFGLGATAVYADTAIVNWTVDDETAVSSAEDASVVLRSGATLTAREGAGELNIDATSKDMAGQTITINDGGVAAVNVTVTVSYPGVKIIKELSHKNAGGTVDSTVTVKGKNDAAVIEGTGDDADWYAVATQEGSIDQFFTWGQTYNSIWVKPINPLPFDVKTWLGSDEAGAKTMSAKVTEGVTFTDLTSGQEYNIYFKTSGEGWGVGHKAYYKNLEIAKEEHYASWRAPAVDKNTGAYAEISENKLIITNNSEHNIIYFVSSDSAIGYDSGTKQYTSEGIRDGIANLGEGVINGNVGYNYDDNKAELSYDDLKKILQPNQTSQTIYVYFGNEDMSDWATKVLDLQIIKEGVALEIEGGKWILRRNLSIATTDDASYSDGTLTFLKSDGEFLLTPIDGAGKITLAKNTSGIVNLTLNAQNTTAAAKFVSANGIAVSYDDSTTTMVATVEPKEYAIINAAYASGNTIAMTGGTATVGGTVSVNITSTSMDGIVISYKGEKDQAYKELSESDIKWGEDGKYFVISKDIEDGKTYAVKAAVPGHYGKDGKIYKPAESAEVEATAGYTTKILSGNFASQPGPFTYEDDDAAAIRKAIEKAISANIYLDKETPELVSGAFDAAAWAKKEIYVAPKTDGITIQDVISNGKKIESFTDTDAIPGGYVAVLSFNKALIDGKPYTKIVPVSANFTIDKKTIYLHAAKRNRSTGEQWTDKTTTDKVGSGDFTEYLGDKAATSYSDKKDLTLASDSVLLLSGNTADSRLDSTGVTFKAGRVTITPSMNESKFKLSRDGKDVTAYYEVEAVPVTFTVEEITESTRLRLDETAYADKLYFGEELDTNAKVERYVDLYLGSGTGNKKTGSNGITYTFGVERGKATYSWTDFKNLSNVSKYKVGSNTSVNVGQVIYVSANYLGTSIGEGTEAELRVGKRPIVISSNSANRITSLAGQELKTTYDGEIDIHYLDYKGNISGEAEFSGIKLKDKVWTTAADMAINLSGIPKDVANVYEISYSDVALSSAMSNVYTLERAQGWYEVKESVIITVKEATTGAVISTNAAQDSTEKTITILTVNNGRKNTEINSVFYNEGGEKKEIKFDRLANGYGFSFDNSNYSLTGEQTIYVFYNDDVEETTGETDVSKTVASIAPVFYSGLKFVASDDTKNFKSGKTGAIEVEVMANGHKLSYGDDYTLSYKNNLNAATASSKKAPTVIVKGVGAYKGMKIEANFSILPAKLSDLVNGDMKDTYVKYTGKVLKPSITVTNKFTKKSINKKAYTLRYFDESGIEVTSTAYAKNANFKKFSAVAYATGQDANFEGDSGKLIEFTGIPSNSKSLKVKGVIKSLSYKGAKAVLGSFIDSDKFEASVGNNSKFTMADNASGRISVRLLTEAGYNDAKKGKTVDNGEDVTTTGTLDAGTYYVAVEPNPKNTAALYDLGVYTGTYIKVNYKGKKLSGLKLAKGSTNFTYDGTDHAVELDPGKVDRSGIKLYLANEPSESYTEAFVRKNGTAYSTLAPGNKISSITNSEPGTYYIYAAGTGEYTGLLRLSYKVGPQKLTKNSPIAVTYAGLEGVAYNAAGYDVSKIQVVWTDSKNSKHTLVADNPSTVSDNDKTDYSITFDKNKKTGTDAGSFTITGMGTYFTGKATYKFNTVKAALSSATEEKRSSLQGSKKVTSGLVQSVTNTYKYGDPVQNSVELKAGSDYKITGVTESGTAAQAVLDASSSKVYTGTRTLKYSVYPVAVKSVAITTDGDSVSFNKTVANFDGSSVEEEGRKIEVTGVTVTMKDGKTVSFVKNPASGSGDLNIATYFDFDWNNNDSVTNKAEVLVSFKDNYGATYPTGVAWVRNYKITNR